MSWDPYIDNLISHAPGHIDKAVLFGQDGAAWTTASHANAMPHQGNELKLIADEMKKNENNGFGATGIRVGGVKYQFLRHDADSNIAYGKKKGEGAITVQATKLGYILAHCPEGSQHGKCNAAVHTVAQYLVSVNM
eukprot:Seg1814.6 transcript_id=Seg1814.6/GoldUCD/mRNA.D3Y31 product=Profilin protein_id=Seg1814.6/GoldUCD/D3Y31